MALSVNRVTSANIYYDGNSLLGKAESFTLQELPFVMSEHKALGALGTTQYFAALDKIEAEMVVTSHYPDLIKLLADPTTSKQMQVRCIFLLCSTYLVLATILLEPVLKYL